MPSKTTTLFALCTALYFTACMSAPVRAGDCPLCESVRENNALYHKNFEYYDDYLKSEAKDKKQDAESKDQTSQAAVKNAIKQDEKSEE